MAMCYGSKSKGLSRSCFPSNLTCSWKSGVNGALTDSGKFLVRIGDSSGESLGRKGGEALHFCSLSGVATGLRAYAGFYFPREINLKHPGKGNLPSKFPLLCLSSGPSYLGNPKMYSLMEGPCKTSQLGQ